MKRSLAVAASALMLSGVTLIAGTSAAQAGTPGWKRCPAKKFCLFEHKNYGGRIAVFSEITSPPKSAPASADLSRAHWYKDKSKARVNDEASSAVNNTGQADPVTIYEHANYGGDPLEVRGRIAKFSDHNFNDRASSIDLE